MMNIFKFSLLFIIFLLSNLWAGPEKFDYLEQYKSANGSDAPGPSEEISSDVNSENIARAEYTYNEKGQLIESIYYLNGKRDGHSVYEYDEKGLKEENLFNASGKLMEKVVFERNSQGQIKGYEVLDAESTIVLAWQFSYENGNLAGGRRMIDAEITEIFKMEYLANGTSIQHVFTGTGEKVGTITTYREKNLVVRRVKSDNTGEYRVDYKYDSKNRLTEMKYFNSQKGQTKLTRIHRFTYSSLNQNLSENLQKSAKL